MQTTMTQHAAAAAPPIEVIAGGPGGGWSLLADLRYWCCRLTDRLLAARPPSRRALAARSELAFRETAALRKDLARVSANTAMLLGILTVAVEDRPELSAACSVLLDGPGIGPLSEGLARMYAVAGHPAPPGLAHADPSQRLAKDGAQSARDARRQRLAASGLHSVPGGAR